MFLTKSKRLTGNRVTSTYSPIGQWVETTSSRLEKFLVGENDVTGRPVPRKVPPSEASSMVISVNSGPHMSSLGSMNVPSLTTKTTLSIGSSTAREQRARQPQTGQGVVAAPNVLAVAGTGNERQSGIYQCAFDFLGCTQSFSSTRDSHNHSLVHFRGKPPPANVKCPLCSSWSTRPGPEAWAARIQHIGEHQRRGERLSINCRPDYDLYSYLRRIGVVTLAGYQELVQHRRCDATQHCYAVLNDPGRDRRNGMPVTAAGRATYGGRQN